MVLTEKELKRCKDCPYSLIKQNTQKRQHCDTCGKDGLIWKITDAGFFYLECTECLDTIAVDMNSPCEEDHVLKQNIELEISAMPSLPDKKTVIDLGKHLDYSALTMRQKLIDGFKAEIKQSDFLAITDFLNSHHIAYSVFNEGGMTEKYPLYRECNYYSPVRLYYR